MTGRPTADPLGPGTNLVSVFFIMVIHHETVGVVVKALHYKPAGQGFDCQWCHSNFSVT